MNINADLFKFPFDDKDWAKKIAIGGGLALLGFILFPLFLPLTGYGLRIMRRTIHEGRLSLPEWDDWGGLFGDGLRYLVVFLVYTLPVWVVMCCAFGAFFIWLPGIETFDEQTLTIVMLVSQFAGFILIGIAMLIGLFLSYFALVALTRAVALGSLNAAFELREVWTLARRGFKHYALAFGVLYGVSFAVGMVSQILIYTIIFLCLYPVFLAVWAVYAQALQGALFGMAYRATQADLDRPVDAPLPGMS